LQMPVAVSYPGVYIEEIPSGVHTITGVATSITAFIGRARLGPIDEPVTITSFSDFERQFGGLAVDYPLSYAVRDFYLNGGSQAIIVRLYKETTTQAAKSATESEKTADSKAKLTVDEVTLTAKSPGEWGKKLRATIDVEVSDEVRTRLGLTPGDVLFNLTIRLGNNVEKFLNITVTDNARRLDRVLKAESNLVDFSWLGTAPAMANTRAAEKAFKAYREDSKDENKKVYEDAKKKLDDDVAQAEKGFAAANEMLDKAKNANPQVPDNITQAEKALETAKTALENAEKGIGGSNGDPLDQKAYEGNPDEKTGFYALDKADLFNLLCIPPDTREGDVPPPVYQEAMVYCQKRRAMLIVDSPTSWSANKNTAAITARDGLATLGLSGEAARNAALYFPRVLQADPLRDGQIDRFAPCGIVAGIMARTDTARGVWKAPAGLDASMNVSAL